MTKEELFEELEPYTIQFIKDNKAPAAHTIVAIAQRWMEDSGLSMEETFEVWNNVMIELVIKHNLAKRRPH